MFFRRPKHTSHLTLALLGNNQSPQEKAIAPGGKVSIGPHPKNTFVIRVPQSASHIDLPNKFCLFKPDRDRYLLYFLPGMTGKIAMGGKALDFQTLLERGVVETKKGRHALSISTKTRGKIMIGSLRLLFRFDHVKPA